MLTRALDAANAYGQTSARPSGSGLGGGTDIASAATGGFSFADALKDSVQTVTQASRAAEVETVKAVAGQADPIDVVTAVNNAEIALETMVSVRDRVISAYQEIMRMPI